MTKEEHIPWQWLLLGILDEHHGQAKLKDIYADIEEKNNDAKKDGIELINQELLKIDLRYGNRPKYQHSVRSHLSGYKKKRGWVIWVDEAVYRLTDQGKKRLEWIKKNG